MPSPLPQLGAHAFLTDAGLETSLIFDDGLDLPDFAAFTLLGTGEGRDALLTYYRRYLDIAEAHGLGVVLDTPTWRASSDWVARQGLGADDVARLNREAVGLLADLRRRAAPGAPVVISGCVGPRGDGYAPEHVLSTAESMDYHREQVAALATAGADLVSAITMTSADEATGIVLASRESRVPVVVSFTVETDGRLPDGTDLDAAIQQVDAGTAGYPAYFMVNCAHPDHLGDLLGGPGAGIARLRGLRCNASRLSHAELDEAEDLDPGDPVELASQYVALRSANPRLTVWGGCCGTNHVHIRALAEAIPPAT